MNFGMADTLTWSQVCLTPSAKPYQCLGTKLSWWLMMIEMYQIPCLSCNVFMQESS